MEVNVLNIKGEDTGKKGCFERSYLRNHSE